MTPSVSQGDFIAAVSAGTVTTCLEKSPRAEELLLCSETIFTELKLSNEIFIGHSSSGLTGCLLMGIQ